MFLIYTKIMMKTKNPNRYSSVQFNSSLDRADLRGARLKASTVILFSIWDGCGQHCIIPVAPDRPLSNVFEYLWPRFLPPSTVPCSISLASVLCLVV